MSDDAGGEAFLLLKCVVLNDRMKKSGNGTSKRRDGLFKHFRKYDGENKLDGCKRIGMPIDE